MAFCCTSSYFTRSGWLRSGRLDCGESANPPQNPVGGFMGVLKMRLALKFRASHSRWNKCWFPLQAKKGELDVTRLRWNQFQWKEKKNLVHSDHFSADKNKQNWKKQKNPKQYVTKKRKSIFFFPLKCCQLVCFSPMLSWSYSMWETHLLDNHVETNVVHALHGHILQQPFDSIFIWLAAIQTCVTERQMASPPDVPHNCRV